MKRRFFLGAALTLTTGACSSAPVAHTSYVDVDLQPALPPWPTDEFYALYKTFQLEIARRSVCHTLSQAAPESKKNPFHGSGVLLDWEGHVALCKHQLHGSKVSLSFLPPSGSLCSASAEILDLAPNYDFAIAKISDKNFISEHNLRPPQMTTKVGLQGKDKVVCVGFVHGNQIHAVEGVVADFVPSLRILDKNVLCKASMQDKILTMPGMSGGGLFLEDGTFIGTHVTAHPWNSKSYYTPAILGRQILATLNGGPPIDLNQIPPECRVTRSQLLRGIPDSQYDKIGVTPQ